MKNDIRATVDQIIANKDMAALIQLIPYARFIGVNAYNMGNEFIYHLPKNDENLGNPMLPALHGGVIGGFMETVGVLHVMMSADTLIVPKVVDFSLDYLSAGRHCDTYAKCKFVRKGRKIANISVFAWQTQEDAPIATARAHFLLI